MADFVAVIRRAVDGLSDNTPEMRVKVYERARGAVRRQLESMKPRPPEEMLRRQLEKLEAAILEVEAEHAEAALVAEELLAEAPAAHEEPPYDPPEEEYVPPAKPVTKPQPYEKSPLVSAETRQADTDPRGIGAAIENGPAPVQHPYAGAVEPEERQFAAAEERAVHAEPEARFVEPVHEQPHDEPAPVEPTIEERRYQAPEVPAAAVAAFEHFAERVRTEPQQEDVASQFEEIWAEVDAPNRAAPDAVAPAIAFTPAAFGHPVRNEPAVQPPVEAAKMPAAEKPFAWDADVFEQLQPTTSTQPAKPPLKGVSENTFDDVDLFDDVHSSKPVRKGEVSGDGWRELKELAGFDKLPDDKRNGGSVSSDFDDAMASKLQGKSYRMEPKRRRFGITGVLLTLVGIAIVGGGGYAAWIYRDALNNMVVGLVSSAPQTVGVTDKPAAPPVQTANSSTTPAAANPAATTTPATNGSAATTPTTQDNAVAQQPIGANAPASANDSAVVNAPAAGTNIAPAANTNVASLDNDANTVNTKFTQRLMADGTEVDDGPGIAPGQPVAVEGKSVAEQNVAATAPPVAAATTPAADANTVQPQPDASQASPDASQAQNTASNNPAATNNPPPATDQQPAADQQQVAQAGDAQKMFLYEERLGQTSPTAIVGSVTWSLQEGKGADGRPEPSVQGLINVPERGLTATITLSRNTDSSLPASHLVELAFQLPPNFEGGAIDSIQRIALKATEQDRGDALIAVPAKVTDDVYMVALNDFPDARKTNLDLLKNRNWIDIPVTYRNGRRALLTMEKGPTGTDAFNKAIAEWNALDGVASSTGQ